MNINFNIYADRRAKGPRANLFIQFSWTENGRQVKRSVSTKMRILKEDYNWKKNTIQPVTKDGEAIRDRVNAIRGFMLTMEESIPDWFINKTRLFIKSAPAIKKERRYRLVELIDKHLELNDSSYSPNTKKAYRTLRVIIEEYIEQAPPDIMSLMDIDEQAAWFSGLVKFLIGKGYRNQSTIQVFKTLSRIKSSFSSSGIDVNPDTFVSGLRVVKPAKVHLTVDELKRALEINEGQYPLFEIFLFMCLTGLRTSEVRGLCNGRPAFDMDGWLTYVSQKTGTCVRVPLHPRAEDIIRRHASIFETFDSEVMMKSVRMVLTGHSIIKGSYVDSYFVGDRLISTERLRAAGLTAHSGRHTFSHVLTEAGVPIDDVSLILGHSAGDTTRNFYRHQSVTDSVATALNNLT